MKVKTKFVIIFVYVGTYIGYSNLFSQNLRLFYPDSKDELDSLLVNPIFQDTCKGLVFGYLPYVEFPSGILELRNLSYLDISSSNFSVLPDSISKLQELKVLNASYSAIERIPNSLFHCPKLEELYLLRTNIHDLPLEIEFATSLSILNISYTKICDLPPNIANCANLKEFSFIGKEGEFCAPPSLKLFLLEKFPSIELWFGEYPE